MATHIVKPAGFVDTRPFVDGQEVLAVVQVKTAPCKGNPDGIVEINVSDYDAKVHKLVNPDDAKRMPKKKQPGPFES